jgi:hypothetical protein
VGARLGCGLAEVKVVRAVRQCWDAGSGRNGRPRSTSD